MTEQQDSPGEPHVDGTQPSGQRPDRSRRRFLGAGAAASPVVLTLMSQPALGGTTCFTPSRSLSKNTSVSQKDKYGTCGTTKSPSQYQGSKNYWPTASGCAKQTTDFHSCFPATPMTCTKTQNKQTVSKTCQEVLDNSTSDIHAYCLTVYLNCQNGTVPSNVLTTTDVVQIWTECVTKGSYEVFAGKSWSPSEVISYFKANGICA